MLWHLKGGHTLRSNGASKAQLPGGGQINSGRPRSDITLLNLHLRVITN